MYRILIAEDNKAISNLIKTHLSFAGYDTSQVYDGEFALEILEAEPFDCQLECVLKDSPAKDWGGE